MERDSTDALSHNDYLRLLCILTEQFSTGYPLLNVLRTAGHELAGVPAAHILSQVIADVEAGSSFAEACSKTPSIIPPLVCYMLREAEQRGTVNVGLARVRDLTVEGVIPAHGDQPLNSARDFPRVVKILGAMKGFGCVDFNENLRVLLYTCTTGRLHEALKAYYECVLNGITMRSRGNVAKILRPYEDVFGPGCVLLYEETDGL